MTRKPTRRRMTFEALEERRLLATGLAGILSRQARLEASLVAIRATRAHATEVSAAHLAGSAVPTQRLIQQRLRKLHHQQLQSQGKILSAASLDNTTIEVRLKQRLTRPLDNVAMYRIPGLTVTSAIGGAGGRSVILKTTPQAGITYTLTMVAIPARPAAKAQSTLSARAMASPPASGAEGVQTLGMITLAGTPPVISPSSKDPVRVVSATSTSNTEVIVQFSEPMSDRALVAQYYEITPDRVNPDSGRLIVKNVRFQEYGTRTGKVTDYSTVILTTESQNEIDYAVRVSNVVDRDGTPLSAAVIAGGVRIDPTTASFQGTPPVISQKNGPPTLIDTDEDGLSDNEEQRGWVVNVTLLDGTVVTRTVTSDIRIKDSDGDGLTDYEEAKLGLDPRSKDTDADQLTDWQEYNEVYSNPLAVDSDGDTLDDSVEFNFFKTSPVFSDTDGDQLRDDYEISSNLNPRVSDLPRPEITVGDINLQLDVHFTETNAKESRDLESRSVTSTLSSSASKSLTRQYTANVEAHINATFKELGAPEEVEIGGSAGFTFDQTEESSSETERSYEQSLNSEKEVTSGFTVQREVTGAVMQATVSLRNVSNLAYRVKNLQATAFIQDPQDHTRLTPVATLLPDKEPDEGFTLGPLVTDRGPIIFSNSTIVPKLVESLMANSSGLIFRVSNYDILNEDGRNFAFVSQDVVQRTARVVIDFGGARSLVAKVSGVPIDENQPGDETEIHRVATSAGQPIDINHDGIIDGNDRRVTFDPDTGKEVGITLFEGLSAIGLTRYSASLDSATGQYQEYEPGGTTPVSLSDDQILSSYSTFVDSTGRERIYRIRGVTNDSINQKYWEILTPLGIDQVTDLSQLILKTDSPVSLNYVQDLDHDGLPADVEFFLRTSDSPLAVGAIVPGTTDFQADESVTYSSDPGFSVSPTRPDLATGTLVRVTSTGGGLIAGTNYYIRLLRAYSYSFYDTEAHARATNSMVGRIDLTNDITAGVFPTAKPASTDIAQDSVTFSTDPGIATATIVRVTDAGGGLTANTDYFIRNLGGGQYSFYDLADHATAGTASTTGRVDLTAPITAGFFSPTAKGRDTDGDGLDDRFEALIGWTVSTPQRTYHVYASPNRADSNFDAPKPGVDSDGNGVEDRLQYDGSDRFAAPAGWTDKNGDGLRDRFEVDQKAPQGGLIDYVLDPIRRDTDGDGINDATEIIGFQITPITGADPYRVTTNPNTPFTDSDTFTDGFERLVGLNPTNGSDTDNDGDGLPDLVETTGWKIGKNVDIPEIQTVTTTFNPVLPGIQQPFTLKYGAGSSTKQNTTVALAANASADAVEAALNSLAAIHDQHGFVTVTQTQTSAAIFVYRISFGGALAGLDQPLLIRTGSATAGAKIQTSGKVFGVEGVSSAPYQPGPPSPMTNMSRTDSVDSDGDGLTDYEEFFLHSDPTSSDTDGDGIEDRVETLGYALGHKVGTNDLGIITTDPLDADTDNDLRSDGAEAELKDVELKRWVVRVTGTVTSGQSSSASAYQVFSNPLVADADFDGLVDGEEYTVGTDPNNANTDGDKRDDGVEVHGGLNPLLEDFRVTVVAEWIETFNDGDAATYGARTGVKNQGGDYQIQLQVRQPDEDGPAGLSTVATDALDGRFVIDNKGESNAGGGGRVFDTYYFSDLVNGFSDRSLTFSLAAHQRFSIELMIREYGQDKNGSPSYVEFDLGGLEGERVYKKDTHADADAILPVFHAEDVQDKSIESMYFYWDSNDQTKPLKRVNGYPGDRVQGHLKVYYVIE